VQAVAAACLAAVVVVSVVVAASQPVPALALDLAAAA
jgi:hypothetical protein